MVKYKWQTLMYTGTEERRDLLLQACDKDCQPECKQSSQAT